MADVKLDYSSVGPEAVTSISSLVSYFNKAINYLQQNSVPSDFSKKSTFSNVVSDLKKQCKELESVKDWLVNSNKNYDSLIDKLNQQALKLPVYQVKKRNKVI